MCVRFASCVLSLHVRGGGHGTDEWEARVSPLVSGKG